MDKKAAIALAMDKEAMDKAVGTKKRGTLCILRATLSTIKGQSPKKPPSANKVSLWRSLAGAVRPLHHLPHCEPPPPPASPRPEVFHDVLLPPPSPPRYSGEVEVDSRYASAEDLRELERQEGGDAVDVDGGDDAIDHKAEEFITKFYEQMKLQRSDSSAI